jgi:transcriptional regulator with XRE-family HTH domain
MTPFGQKIRKLRQKEGITQSRMAEDLGISPAYLSALEHGRRSRPSWALVQNIISYFNIIWDEAEDLEELARLSHPRIVIDTAGLDPAATELVNRLARDIPRLKLEKIARLLKIVKED